MRRTSSKRLLEVLPLEGLVDATAAGRARAVFAASWIFYRLFSTQAQTFEAIWNSLEVYRRKLERDRDGHEESV